MSDWDVIECGFNVADETINFGTRCLGQSDNLYEASTLATFKNTENEQKDIFPCIKACVKADRIFISINKTMRVFENATTLNLFFNAAFEDPIDTFSTTSDGNYLLVCLKSGVFHFIKVKIDNEDEEQTVFTKTLESTEEISENVYFVFSHVEELENNFRIMLVTSKGKVACANVLKKKLNEPFLEIEYDFETTIFNASYNPPFLIVNGKQLLVYNFKKKTCCFSDALDLKRILPMDIPTFIALDKTGKLIIICGVTLQIYYLNTFPSFEDFFFTCNSENEYYIYGIIKNEVTLIQVSPFLAMDTLFSIKSTGLPVLVIPESVNEDLMYINCIEGKELRLQIIAETIPEKRLQKLLRSLKFEEAKNLIKLFNLDMEELLKAKVDVFLRKPSCCKEDIDDFLNLLEKINDKNFKYLSIISVTCERLEDVRRVLIYGCNLHPKSGTNEDNNLYVKICNLMYNFDTFSALSRLNGSKYDIHFWDSFSSCNLLETLKLKLKLQNIEEAVFLFTRLDSSLKLSNDDVEIILNLLNNVSYYLIFFLI